MNTVAILPQLVMKLLQTQNIKRNNVATVKANATEMLVPENRALLPAIIETPVVSLDPVAFAETTLSTTDI
jgi:hypothetical protein